MNCRNILEKVRPTLMKCYFNGSGEIQLALRVVYKPAEKRERIILLPNLVGHIGFSRQLKWFENQQL